MDASHCLCDVPARQSNLALASRDDAADRLATGGRRTKHMVTRRALEALSLTLAFAALGACGGKARPVAVVGETTCATCHGFPPAKDAHLVHANGGALDKQLACLECHKNVQRVNDVDHIVDVTGKPLPPPAVVRFDDPAALAAKTEPGSARADEPKFQPDRTCSNVYCHGATLKGQTQDLITAPSWGAVGQNQAACGRCHAIPPADHPSGLTALNCVRCHAPAIDAQGQLDPALHVNGEVNLVAANLGACSGCHGDRAAQNVPPGDPRSAPPLDVAGRTDSAAVGAHQAHLTGTRWRTSPIACNECHVVPSAVLDPGHVDDSVQIVFGALAKTQVPPIPTPSYTFATHTCSNVYCHGGFGNSGRTTTTPDWTAGVNEANCGTCHSIPPPGPQHPPTGTADCGICHDGYTISSVNKDEIV